jgi:2-methylcitrate dehydratase PrpD
VNGSNATIAAALAEFSISVGPLPHDVETTCRRLVQDVVGLVIAARNTDYVSAALASASAGPCTAIGHPRAVAVLDAALVNGTAAHGEDFDDTFEGGPVHAGAVIVPAVLAAAEARGIDGRGAMRGIAVGVELLCRMSLVAPQAIHRAGFHPTAVIGAPAAAAAVAATLGLSAQQCAHALGVACSLSSGIIEYLADGSWTKRLHAGAAAQSGIRAALLAEGGFTGPATVFEGVHGFYKAFAPSLAPNFEPLLDALGTDWITPRIAFKPYACGTMTQPFVDCAIEAGAPRAARGGAPPPIETNGGYVGGGTGHPRREPRPRKPRPPHPCWGTV